ncbi:MAG: phage tail protein [Pseudomonadota bacterium]
MTAFEKQAFPKAASRSINEALKKVETHTVRALASSTGARQKTIRATLKRGKASQARLIASLSSRAERPLSLMEFGARQTKKGVSSKAWGKRKLYRHAFIASMPNGKVGVFTRKRTQRLPIKTLYGPSIPREMADNEIKDMMNSVFQQRLRDRFPHNLDRAVRQYLKRIG